MAKEVTFPVSYHDFYKTNGSDTRVFNNEPSLTRQEFAEECDINSIMKRYEGYNTGPNGLPNMQVGEPMYADFTQVPTNLLDYMQIMDTAQTEFMKLPATVRRTFDNSAVEFVAFASDPGNIDQLRAWGLAKAAPLPKAPEPVGDAPPAPPPPSAKAPGGGS